jgi:hypothetical protein
LSFPFWFSFNVSSLKFSMQLSSILVSISFLTHFPLPFPLWCSFNVSSLKFNMQLLSILVSISLLTLFPLSFPFWCSFNVSSLKFKILSKSYDNCYLHFAMDILQQLQLQKDETSKSCKNLTQLLDSYNCINKIKFNVISIWFLQLSHKQVQFH